MKSGTMVVLRDGSIRVIDPQESMLPVLKNLDPGFEIESEPPACGFLPGFQRLRKGFICRLDRYELRETTTDMLWAIHYAAVNGKIPLDSSGEVSLLDLKIELGKRALNRCALCGWQCGANRNESLGRCGASARSLFSSVFKHIGEEAPINPAWIINLVCCPMRCVFCQSHEHHTPGEGSELLDANTWGLISPGGVVGSLEFVGGEPVVSSPGILQFLSSAPEDLCLPVVMNCSAFLSPTALNLLNGVVDVWVPDFTFGNDTCARRLSGVERYWETATTAISLMYKHDAKVIVRILALPGHADCCHKNTLDWLSRYRDRLWISILDQYLPLHLAPRHRDINRLPKEDEIRETKTIARKMGLRDVNDRPGDFWG